MQKFQSQKEINAGMHEGEENKWCMSRAPAMLKKREKEGRASFFVGTEGKDRTEKWKAARRQGGKKVAHIYSDEVLEEEGECDLERRVRHYDLLLKLVFLWTAFLWLLVRWILLCLP